MCGTQGGRSQVMTSHVFFMFYCEKPLRGRSCGVFTHFTAYKFTIETHTIVIRHPDGLLGKNLLKIIPMTGLEKEAH